MTRDTRHITLRALSVFVGSIGGVSFVGIFLETASLASWIPGAIPMALSTAVSTMATGITLFLLSNERPKH